MAVVIGDVLKRLVAGDTLCRRHSLGTDLNEWQLGTLFAEPAVYVVPLLGRVAQNAARRGLLGSNMRHFELDFDIGTGSLLELISRHLSARGGGFMRGMGDTAAYLSRGIREIICLVLFYFTYLAGEYLFDVRVAEFVPPSEVSVYESFIVGASVIGFLVRPLLYYRRPMRSIRRATSRACCWYRHCCC